MADAACSIIACRDDAYEAKHGAGSLIAAFDVVDHIKEAAEPVLMKMFGPAKRGLYTIDQINQAHSKMRQGGQWREEFEDLMLLPIEMFFEKEILFEMTCKEVNEEINAMVKWRSWQESA